MNIGFIGLGNMGLPMAINLQKAGYQVAGFDLVQSQLDAFAKAGGKTVANANDAAKNVDVLISMLPASQHVEGLYLGDSGLLANTNPQTILVDCSTISPKVAQAVASAAQAKGFEMVDAPVSGGTAGAQAGTLTFMVGGQQSAVERIRPLLEKMGKNIFHAGANGAGQTVKVCNNMLLGIQMLGTCEALRLGIANGMDPKILSDIMSKSSGRNWALELYNPCPGVMDNVPSSKDYAGGFGVDLMLKDMGLATENAEALEASVPLGKLAQQLYEAHSKAGHGQLDFSSVFNLK
ncbi:3-hydroxyisobutyrate dehydrogenase [Polynucleobacter sp. QLW-P1DATA-2]|jgi:3-hydroxyisobutyrate dehydrogenase|uniref:3-hydroxyisobutyrate dehydrogenase n=1 Tax=unclassified Polynucleobacter TaxID=2640945 RepID=UPI0008F809CF|nr:MULTISPECIES: 3-hydroxyisobutyrate dehydrogenase [unclassified Polynucleobacter]OIM98411.1 3-hydroxyisobutyrate dehydrogenase [Polynucleobacter sp. MWH-Tro8-2-5-gr]OIN00320.1 3-hydroxyisobutyrate dehydrogenase [Polynucleobacter sp. QLW-P1DATA-2]